MPSGKFFFLEGKSHINRSFLAGVQEPTLPGTSPLLEVKKKSQGEFSRNKKFPCLYFHHFHFKINIYDVYMKLLVICLLK